MLKTPFERDGIKYIPMSADRHANSLTGFAVKTGQWFALERSVDADTELCHALFIPGCNLSRADVVKAFAELVENE